MFPTIIKHLDLAVKRVPGVEPSTTVAAPAPFAIRSAKKLEIVKN
jgi:hypothetical protein